LGNPSKKIFPPLLPSGGEDRPARHSLGDGGGEEVVFLWHNCPHARRPAARLFLHSAPFFYFFWCKLLQLTAIRCKRHIHLGASLARQSATSATAGATARQIVAASKRAAQRRVGAAAPARKHFEINRLPRHSTASVRRLVAVPSSGVALQPIPHLESRSVPRRS
jgi:hypothetical protein